jgi:phospholipid transport system substrate-binding protein
MYLDDVRLRDKQARLVFCIFGGIRICLMHIVHCRRRSLLAATAALVVVAGLPAHAAENDPVIQPVQQLVDGLLEIMKAGPGTPFQQRFEILDPIINRAFDLQTILEESVGPHWSSLPANEQDMLKQAFRRYTVASYVNSFDKYDGQRFDIKPDTRPVGNGEQVVQTQIIPRKGTSHQLDYVMRQGSDGWHAVDVLADGAVSRVAVQRSDFRRLLTRGGAQALANSLRTKTANLSEGNG